MTNIEINELISVLEEIRVKQHPEIPATLVQEIINSEFLSQDDRAKGRHDTQKIVNEYLKNISI